MKKQLLWITCILALAACEKEIAPSNPCETQQATSAAFTIKEATYTQIIEPRLADFLMDTDTVYFRSVYFEATQADADSFIWQIGTEPEPRYGKQVNVVFPDVLRGTTFTIRLIVKRNKPNTLCFPSDNGIDTMIRTFYFLRYNEELSWEGTYYGSDDDKPDSMYTIVLGHSYDIAEEEDIIKAFGVPRGCNDTMNRWIHSSRITYKNVGFSQVGFNCSGKTILGLYKEYNQYRIEYRLKLFENNINKSIDRVFIGTKIN